jgi:hypothetical protein
MLGLRGCFAGAVQILRCAQDDISSHLGLTVILSEAKDLPHSLTHTTLDDLARTAA